MLPDKTQYSPNASAPPPVPGGQAPAPSHWYLRDAGVDNTSGTPPMAHAQVAGADGKTAGAIEGRAMPVVVAEAEIVQQYQQQGYDISAIESMPVATAETIPESGTWFSPEEMAILNAQPIVTASAVPNDNTAAATVIQNTTDGGLPVMMNAHSSAMVSVEGAMKAGIVSRDPILDNKDEIINFLNMHNTRPSMFIEVHGYHYEQRRRGNDTRSETVTDFRYRLNVTDFIFPFGKVTCEGASKNAIEMIEHYVKDENMLRSLQMTKRVVWNSKALCHLVKNYVRQSGWRKELSVNTIYENTSVRIADDNELAQAYDNCCCRCLMVVTVVPALLMCLYGQGHRERGMKSIFTIEATPLQVFEAIRPQIDNSYDYNRFGGKGCMIQ